MDAPAPTAPFTVKDVALRLGVCRSFVYEEVRAGRIAHERRGSRIRFAAADVEAWLAKNRHPEVPESPK